VPRVAAPSIGEDVIGLPLVFDGASSDVAAASGFSEDLVFAAFRERHAGRLAAEPQFSHAPLLSKEPQAGDECVGGIKCGGRALVVVPLDRVIGMA
jgi:hypothetical protein